MTVREYLETLDKDAKVAISFYPMLSTKELEYSTVENALSKSKYLDYTLYGTSTHIEGTLQLIVYRPTGVIDIY